MPETRLAWIGPDGAGAATLEDGIVRVRGGLPGERVQWTGDLRMGAIALRTLADNREVIEGLADDGRDAGPCILHLDAPARPPSQAKRILITSTYDESQQARLDEYVECVRRNARNFDILLFLYERSSNRFAVEIAELFHNAADHESAQPLFLDINSRPTFEQLFATPAALVVSFTLTGCLLYASGRFDRTQALTKP